MIIFISVILGGLLALIMDWYIPPALSAYAGIFILAALDSIFGGVRAYLYKKFDAVIFVTGLTGNSVIAVFLMFIGNRLGVDLYLAAILVFGMRMFQNFASIRRYYLGKVLDKKQKNEEKDGELYENSVKTTINGEEF